MSFDACLVRFSEYPTCESEYQGMLVTEKIRGFLSEQNLTFDKKMDNVFLFLKAQEVWCDFEIAAMKEAFLRGGYLRYDPSLDVLYIDLWGTRRMHAALSNVTIKKLANCSSVNGNGSPFVFEGRRTRGGTSDPSHANSSSILPSIDTVVGVKARGAYAQTKDAVSLMKLMGVKSAEHPWLSTHEYRSYDELTDSRLDGAILLGVRSEDRHPSFCVTRPEEMMLFYHWGFDIDKGEMLAIKHDKYASDEDCTNASHTVAPKASIAAAAAALAAAAAARAAADSAKKLHSSVDFCNSLDAAASTESGNHG